MLPGVRFAQAHPDKRGLRQLPAGGRSFYSKMRRRQADSLCAGGNSAVRASSSRNVAMTLSQSPNFG
jgi:hypothetical protein